MNGRATSDYRFLAAIGECVVWRHKDRKSGSPSLMSLDEILQLSESMTPIERLALVWLGTVFAKGSVKLAIQEPVGEYRVDFMVASPRASVVVECDGHEFHEKTKEQASRDKLRDRAIQMAGHRVFRYSGADIYNRPWLPASEVATYFRQVDELSMNQEASDAGLQEDRAGVQRGREAAGRP